MVLISVDGLNPAAIRERGTRTSSGAPTFAALTRDAVGTLEARSTLEQTNTLPNHSSMLTGRPVAGPTGTGVVFNSDNGETLRASAGQYVPGVFDVVHDHGLPTALFAEKDKFQFLVRSWDASNGAEDVTGVDDGRRKIDEVLIAPAAQLLPAVERRLRSGRGGLIFLHVAAPDYAGHATGFMSPRYLDAVDTAADEVATVLGVVRAAPGLRRRTTVILTADHGGRGPSHSDATDPNDYRIPFFVWGPGVRAGDLYAMNPRRRDPGTGRPPYTGPQPIRNMDAAELALRSMGLSPLPHMFGSGEDVLLTH